MKTAAIFALAATSVVDAKFNGTIGNVKVSGDTKTSGKVTTGNYKMNGTINGTSV